MITVFKDIKSHCIKENSILFSLFTLHKARNNKLIVYVLQDWNRLPGKIVGCL